MADNEISDSSSPKKALPPDNEPDQATLDAHRLMVMWLFIATLLVALTFLVLMLRFDITGQGPSVMVVVIISGSLGGFVSSLRRLYSFQDIFPRKQYVQLFRKTNFYVIAYSFVPALVGMIGAAVIYVVFAAGLLKGGVFPEFHCSATTGDCSAFYSFVANWSPNGPAEFGKAIIWGFIAGFSERFVPDILNRLGSKASE